MPSPDYLPLALDLPAIYRDDQASFAQLDSYLALIDTLLRDDLADLFDIELWLSPDGLTMWPPGVSPDSPPAGVHRAYLACQDELAAWTGFAFPVGWPQDDVGLRKRRTYLQRAARLWRRRGTPAGLVDWFSLAFDSALGGEKPRLIEHYKVADPLAPETVEDEPWLRATLFVPDNGDFGALSLRRQAIAFVDRYAPAHVHVRVCWYRPDAFVFPAAPTSGSTQTQVTAWQTQIRKVLCELVNVTDHAHAIRVWECIGKGEAKDRLGVGTLPGGGSTPP